MKDFVFIYDRLVLCSWGCNCLSSYCNYCSSRNRTKRKSSSLCNVSITNGCMCYIWVSTSTILKLPIGSLIFYIYTTFALIFKKHGLIRVFIFEFFAKLFGYQTIIPEVFQFTFSHFFHVEQFFII